MLGGNKKNTCVYWKKIFKKAQLKSRELCFIWPTKDSSGRQSLRLLWELFQRHGGGARIRGVLVTKTSSQNIEKLLLKTRYLKLMNLALYCVWEDARVWAFWNHSFDMLHYNLRPVSCFLPSWIPSGCSIKGRAGEMGGTCSSWWLDALTSLYTDTAGNILCPHVVPVFKAMGRKALNSNSDCTNNYLVWLWASNEICLNHVFFSHKSNNYALLFRTAVKSKLAHVPISQTLDKWLFIISNYDINYKYWLIFALT